MNTGAPTADMMLTAAELAAMYQACVSRTTAYATRLVRRAEGDDSLTPDVVRYLHMAARVGHAVDEEHAVALIAAGQPALEAATQALSTHRLFTPEQQQKIDDAAQKQHIYPQVAQVFGEQTRLYLHCVDDAAGNVTRTRIESHLQRHGYTVTDYAQGYATDAAGKQQFRIGKLLKTHAPALYDSFISDTSRAADKLRVVICRGSDDIARMTTGRGWKSCMEAGKAEFNAFVPRDIEHGTLVAYLVSERDPDIHAPLARLLIKPYISDTKATRTISQASLDQARAPAISTMRRGGLMRMFSALGVRHAQPHTAPAPVPATLTDTDVVFVPEAKVYGLDSHSLRATVTAFVAQHLNHGPDGGYLLSPLLYCDGNNSREVVKRGDTLHVMRGYAGNAPV